MVDYSPLGDCIFEVVFVIDLGNSPVPDVCLPLLRLFDSKFSRISRDNKMWPIAGATATNGENSRDKFCRVYRVMEADIPQRFYRSARTITSYPANKRMLDARYKRSFMKKKKKKIQTYIVVASKRNSKGNDSGPEGNERRSSSTVGTFVWLWVARPRESFCSFNRRLFSVFTRTTDTELQCMHPFDWKER